MTFREGFSHHRWRSVKRVLEIKEDNPMISKDEVFFFGPNKMMKEIHDAFGGQLWFGKEAERLCYSKGVEVSAPFMLQYLFTCMDKMVDEL